MTGRQRVYALYWQLLCLHSPLSFTQVCQQLLINHIWVFSRGHLKLTLYCLLLGGIFGTFPTEVAATYQSNDNCTQKYYHHTTDNWRDEDSQTWTSIKFYSYEYGKKVKINHQTRQPYILSATEYMLLITIDSPSYIHIFSKWVKM